MRGVFAALAFALAATGAAAAPLPVETLAGRSLTVPDGLAGDPRLLVVAFTHDARQLTEQWDQRLATLCAGPAPSCYDVAIIEKMPGFVRGFAIGRMRDKVAPARQPYFLLAKTDTAGWRQLAGAPDEPGDDAYLIVLASDGSVKWRGRGAWSAPLEAELRQALAP